MTTLLHTNFQYTRWTDSIERSVMNQVLSNGEALSIKDLGISVMKGLKKMARAIGNGLVKMAEAMYEARMKEAGTIARMYY